MTAERAVRHGERGDRTERDLRLARQVRHGYRRAEELGDALQAFMNTEEARRWRRFQAVAGALKAVLGEVRAQKVTATAIKAGVLTLEVADSVLLAELRAHQGHALLTALAEAGTGVSRIAWRAAATKRPAR